MKQLLKQLKNYKKESILAPLFKLLEASFELLVPLLVAAIIDRGVAQAQTGYIVRMGLLMIGLGLAGLAASVTAQYFAAKAAVGATAQLRRELFAHLQSLSYSQLDTLGVPTMLTRLTSDMNQVQSGLNLTLRLLLRSPFVVFGAMIMAFTIDTRAALVFACVIPVLAVVVVAVMLLTIPLYRRVQERLDRVTGMTRENLQGVRVIRAFRREEKEIETFEQGNEALVGIQVLSGRISALMNPLTYVVINGGLLVLLYTGAIRVDGGFITQGAVVALVNYMSQILVELVKLANLIINVTKAIACGNRIGAIMDLEPDVVSGAGASKTETANGKKGNVPAVEFDHVSFRYKNAGADSLTGITFRAMPGETIGIIGGTGSGKSSLVSLIPRFYDVREGCVRVNGTDVREYQLDALRNKVGMVMQKAVLFAGTIRDNLLWGNEHATEEELREAIHAAQADEVVFKGKGGLDAVVEQEGRNFSG